MCTNYMGICIIQQNIMLRLHSSKITEVNKVMELIFCSHALLGLASTSCITPPLRTSSVVLSQFDSEPLVNLDSDGV